MKTTAPTITDTASRAVLMQNLLRAQRLPLCGLCAGTRRIVTDSETGARFAVCERCGDAAPVREVREEERPAA
jgi:hypothetical protein